MDGLRKLVIRQNSKCPTMAWKTETDKKKSCFFGKPNPLENYGILTGKDNQITAVDLDTYKSTWGENHLFKQEFQKEMDVNFNTYSQKTTNGGLHYFFKYVPELTNINNKEFEIDIKNEGGYIIGAGSKINGKEYTIVNDTDILEMPERLKNWLLSNLYPKSKSCPKVAHNIKNKNATLGQNRNYEYDITKSKVGQIVKVLDKKFFTNYDDWLKFTTFMKAVGQRDLWDDASKRYGKGSYNKEQNDNIWSGANANYECFYKLIEDNEFLSESIIDHAKYKPTPLNTRVPSQVIYRRKLDVMKGVDKPDNVNPDTMPLVIKDATNYVIKSDTGTGKTTLFKNHIKKTGFKFISIVSRRSLAEEQYSDLCKAGITCVHYSKNPRVFEGDNVITTIDSIMKCYSLAKNIEEYVIFIDEFNSVVEYILSADATIAKVREPVVRFLIGCLTRCKQFIGVDADISDLVFKLTDYVNCPVRYIQNTYKHNNGVSTTEVFHIDIMVELIKQEKKYIVCCDSANLATLLHEKTGKSAYLITGDTDFVGHLDDYDKVIFSPTIIYGMDSTMNRKVFLLMKEHTISPRNMVQQATRCRDIKHLYYCFMKKKFKPAIWDNITECRQEQERLGSLAHRTFCPFQNESVELEALFTEMELLYLYSDNCYNTNKFVHFRMLLKSRGFKVDENTAMTTKLGKEEFGEIKKLREDGFSICDPRVIEINEKYLNLTDGQLTEVKDLFIKPELLSNYFSVRDYLKYPTSEKLIAKYSDINHKMNDFDIKKMTNHKQKVLFLENLKLYSGFTIDENGVFDMPDIKHHYVEKVNEYHQIFRDRSKDKVKINDKHDLLQLINKIKKKIFGDITTATRCRDKDARHYKYSYSDKSDVMKIYNKINEFNVENGNTIKIDDYAFSN